jgi:hypothetical protein
MLGEGGSIGYKSQIDFIKPAESEFALFDYTDLNAVMEAVGGGATARA